MVRAKVEDETTHEALARQFTDIYEWAKAEGYTHNPSVALTQAELGEAYARTHVSSYGTREGLARWRKWVERNVKER